MPLPSEADFEWAEQVAALIDDEIAQEILNGEHR